MSRACIGPELLSANLKHFLRLPLLPEEIRTTDKKSFRSQILLKKRQKSVNYDKTRGLAPNLLDKITLQEAFEYFDPDQAVLLLPGMRWQQWSPHHQNTQWGWRVLCSSELMPNKLILSTTTLSGHSTHVRMGTDSRPNFLHWCKTFTSTQVSESLPTNTCWGSLYRLQGQYLRAFIENLLVQKAIYMLNLPPICTLPSNQQAFFSRWIGSWWQSK